MRSLRYLSVGILLLAALPLWVSAQEKAPRKAADERKKPLSGPSAEGGAVGTIPASQTGPTVIIIPTQAPSITPVSTPSSSPTASPTPTSTPGGSPSIPGPSSLTPTSTTTPTPSPTVTSTLTPTPTPGVFRFLVSPRPGGDGKIRFNWGVNVQSDEVFLKVYSSGFRLVHGWHFDPKEGREYLIAGSHEFLWDGRDGYGRKFPPGMYLCFIDIRVGEKHFESSGRTEIP